MSIQKGDMHYNGRKWTHSSSDSELLGCVALALASFPIHSYGGSSSAITLLKTNQARVTLPIFVQEHEVCLLLFLLL